MDNLKTYDTKSIMAKLSKTDPMLSGNEEELSRRIARLRKERGFTQAEIAKEVGTTREVVSDYERGRIRPHYKMIIQFAKAFKITTDELLGLKPSKANGSTPSLKIMKRLKMIEALPSKEQKALLRTIDTFLENIQLKKRIELQK